MEDFEHSGIKNETFSDGMMQSGVKYVWSCLVVAVSIQKTCYWGMPYIKMPSPRTSSGRDRAPDHQQFLVGLQLPTCPDVRLAKLDIYLEKKNRQCALDITSEPRFRTAHMNEILLFSKPQMVQVP